jgi:hypothetical protein
LEGLWTQFDAARISRDGLILELTGEVPASAKSPALPLFYQRSRRADHGKEDLRSGFTLDLWAQFPDLTPGQALLDNRTEDGRGFALLVTAHRGVELLMNDGRSESRWASDANVLTPGKPQHIAVIVDGGPKVISFVVNGLLCDGGEERQSGWGRFSPNLRSANGAETLRVASGVVKNLRVYNRYLKTSEAIAAHRAGMLSAPR